MEVPVVVVVAVPAADAEMNKGASRSGPPALPPLNCFPILGSGILCAPGEHLPECTNNDHQDQYEE